MREKGLCREIQLDKRIGMQQIVRPLASVNKWVWAAVLNSFAEH
jgi:hypothetical protein